MNHEPILDYISLGLRIRQARQEHNMTQAELGEACSLYFIHRTHRAWKSYSFC